MTREGVGEVVAAVVFEAPHGTDGLVISESMGPTVPFGRGGSCPIRFGFAPDVDRRLARRAGAFLILGQRLIVESSSEPDHPPLQVRIAGRPPVELSQGELYSPPVEEFEVIARGERDWTMTVRTRRQPSAYRATVRSDDPPTDRLALRLTDHEQQVLDAYLVPLRAGKLEPATHGDVAEQLHFSVNKVRGDLYGIWAKMISEGVSMPEYADKRVAVANAAISNGIA